VLLAGVLFVVSSREGVVVQAVIHKRTNSNGIRQKLSGCLHGE